MKKAELKEKILEVIESDNTFGNEFCNQADAWRDACQIQLDRLSKKELLEWYEKSKSAEYQPEEAEE